jgi:hypothetical protein
MEHSLTRLRICLVCAALVCFEQSIANPKNWPHPPKKPKITIGKPKIKVGPPKIVIPSPATVIKNVAVATVDVAKDVTVATSVAASQTASVVNNVGTATATAVNQVGAATGVAASQVVQGTGTVAGAVITVGENIAKETGVALHNTGKVAGKGAKDLVLETGRIPGHLVDAGDALITFGTTYSEALADKAKAAERQLRQGKLADALFDTALLPLSAQEEAAFAATQKSGWVNSAGAVAAAAYGGPGGSAAYAAWQTYRLTDKNVELAIRAGIIAGLTKAATGEVGKLSGAETPDMIKKAVLAGAVSGMAIAASGGDEAAIRGGIAMGGGMVLIQDGYRNYIGQELNAKGATEPPYCTSPSDPSCDELRKAYSYNKDTGESTLNTEKLNLNKSWVGQQTPVGTVENPIVNPDIPAGTDRLVVMQGFARVPAFNAMAVFHDKWAVDWNMGSIPGLTQVTIFPAIALTYIGAGAPLFTSISNEVAAEAQPLSTTPATSAQQNPPTTEAVQKVALEAFDTRLVQKSDSIAKVNKGVEVLGDGILKPAAG